MKFFIRPMVLSHVASRKAFAVVCLSVVCCLLYLVSCQLSVVSCQLSVVSCQLSVVSCQLSVVSCQLSVVSCQLSVVSCQLSVVSCQLSVVSCQLSVVKVSPFPREQTLRLYDPTAVDWQCIASCSLNDWSLSILSSRRKYV